MKQAESVWQSIVMSVLNTRMTGVINVYGCDHAEAIMPYPSTCPSRLSSLGPFTPRLHTFSILAAVIATP